MKNSNLCPRLMSTSAIVMVVAGAVAAMGQTNGDTLETVVVTGTREEAQEAKKDAPNVVDVQSLESIRALPDGNAAEARARLPGVSLESDSGDCCCFKSRGMDADL